MDFQSPADLASGHSAASNSDFLENIGRKTYSDEDEEEDDFESASMDGPSPTYSSRWLHPEKEFVEDLRPEEVRWFYRSDGSKKWTSFIG